MPANTLGYPTDVFISYRHNPLHKEWLKDIFLPQFEPRLAAELDVTPKDLAVYWDDDLRTGEDWSEALLEALKTSCCMLGVWSRAYFRSPWCLAEWLTFVEREKKVQQLVKRLVAPILLQPDDAYPADARARTPAAFQEYLITGEAFRKNDLYVTFQQRVQQLAEDVAAIISASPQHAPPWPLVDPKTVQPPPPASIGRVVLGKAA